MINQGEGYVFFEIIEPEELSFTYKVNQAAFSTPWVRSSSYYASNKPSVKASIFGPE